MLQDAESKRNTIVTLSISSGSLDGVTLCIAREKRWFEAKICHQPADSVENKKMERILKKFNAKGFPCAFRVKFVTSLVHMRWANES